MADTSTGAGSIKDLGWSTHFARCIIANENNKRLTMKAIIKLISSFTTSKSIQLKILSVYNKEINLKKIPPSTNTHNPSIESLWT